MSYLRVFGCKCFILNNCKDKLGKLDAKADEGICLRYSSTSKACRVYNKRNLIVEKSVHVAFDETPPQMVSIGTSFDIIGIDTKDIVEDGVQQTQYLKLINSYFKLSMQYFNKLKGS